MGFDDGDGIGFGFGFGDGNGYGNGGSLEKGSGYSDPITEFRKR